MGYMHSTGDWGTSWLKDIRPLSAVLGEIRKWTHSEKTGEAWRREMEEGNAETGRLCGRASVTWRTMRV